MGSTTSTVKVTTVQPPKVDASPVSPRKERNLALGGVLLPATGILAVTLTAAIWPALQGILLTVEVLGFFIAAMLLLAKIRAAGIATPASGQEIPSAPEEHA